MWNFCTELDEQQFYRRLQIIRQIKLCSESWGTPSTLKYIPVIQKGRRAFMFERKEGKVDYNM